MELHEEDLQLLLTLTDRAAHLWQKIGLNLGFMHSELQVIARMPLLIPEGAPGYYREMIARWLEWATPTHPLPTVEALASALRKASRERLALDLEREFTPVKEKGSASGRVSDLPLRGSPQSVTERTDEPPSTTCTVPGPIPNLHVPAQHTIENEIEELEDQFLNVVRKAAKDLRNVDLSDVKLCITQLRVSVKYQHIRFLECKAAAINDAQSVDSIFVILGRYWDFLNCGLLSEIVRNFGNEATKQLMEKYMENLKQFRMKTKLGDFIGKWAHSTPPQFTSFVSRMGGEWEDNTLEDLEEFRKELARSMYVEEYALHFDGAKPGSIAVTWAIHSSFQERYIPDLKSLESPPSATPLDPLSPPTPLEESEQENFDMISALLSAGVPHIPGQILECLDVKSLVRSEQVSVLWRDTVTVSDLSIWKHLVKNNTDSDKLWRALFERRGWSKYLDVSLPKQMSSRFYRHLYQSASRDIHSSLEENWRRGQYTLTKIETGSTVLCLQYDDTKLVTGHVDGTIKVGSCWSVVFLSSMEQSCMCAMSLREGDFYDKTVQLCYSTVHMHTYI